MLQWAHSRDWLDAKQTYIFSGTQLNYGHTSFYCVSQVLYFFQIEGLCQCCVKQVYWCHFSKIIGSLPVSMSPFGNSHNISNFFITITFVIVISDQ